MSQAENLPTTANNDLGAALEAAMNGQGDSVSVGSAPQPTTSERPVNGGSSDLENMQEATPPSDNSDVPPLGDGSADLADPSSAGPDGPAGNPSEFPEVELKVKGYDEPVKVKLDPNDDSLKSLLNKGQRFDKAMQQLAQQRKDLEAKLAGLADYDSKAEIASRVEAAKEYMENGYSDAALNVILGDRAEEFIQTLVEDRIAYQNATPEERLKMDIERQNKNEQLRRKQDEDRIAKLEAQINSRSEEVRQAEFRGYVEDAKSRYDLSQWVEDTDTASDLNDMLHTTAMADIVKLQRQREAKGEPSVTQRDIRRAYATRAKRLVQGYQRQSQETANQTIAEQSQVAKQNAQVASTRNYGSNDALSQWREQGGTMADFVDALSKRGGII